MTPTTPKTISVKTKSGREIVVPAPLCLTANTIEGKLRTLKTEENIIWVIDQFLSNAFKKHILAKLNLKSKTNPACDQYSYDDIQDLPLRSWIPSFTKRLTGNEKMIHDINNLPEAERKKILQQLNAR